MATLFQRLISDIDATEKRIPIHSMSQLLRELHRGAINAQTIIDAYSLTPTQITELQTINTRITASSNKQRYFEFIFSLLSLGEIAQRGDTNGKLSSYADEAAFWARINGHG